MKTVILCLTVMLLCACAHQEPMMKVSDCKAAMFELTNMITDEMQGIVKSYKAKIKKCEKARKNEEKF